MALLDLIKGAGLIYPSFMPNGCSGSIADYCGIFTAFKINTNDIERDVLVSEVFLSTRDPIVATTGGGKFRDTTTRTFARWRETAAPVPLPASALMLMSGLAAMGFLRRRRQA